MCPPPCRTETCPHSAFKRQPARPSKTSLTRCTAAGRVRRGILALSPGLSNFGAFKNVACLLQEGTHIRGLKDVAPEENSRGPRCDGSTYNFERVGIRSLAASTQHEDGDGTTVNNRAHGFRITAVIGLDRICSQFSCHAGVQVEPLGISGARNALPTG